ncbi:MAG TPA: hypothetical protein VEX68_27775 [Bryobacteraceae bacterium]|nr:hypothetical protein [Bryobacteraceae bacterium]
MKALVIATLTCFAVTAATADSRFIGRWEINMAKSKRDAAAQPITTRTIVYTMEGSVLKAVVTTNGRPLTPVLYDGQEHKVESTTTGFTHITGTVAGNTLKTEFKIDGKVVAIRKNSLSSDGRTMTVVADATMPDGTKTHSEEVYDKK